MLVMPSLAMPEGSVSPSRVVANTTPLVLGPDLTSSLSKTKRYQEKSNQYQDQEKARLFVRVFHLALLSLPDVFIACFPSPVGMNRATMEKQGHIPFIPLGMNFK